MADALNLEEIEEIKAYAAAGRQCPCCLERFDCLPECTAAQEGPREHEALESGRDDDRTILALVARVDELESLIRSRCEIYCAKDYIPRDMHAPDCLVEEAGIK